VASIETSTCGCKRSLLSVAPVRGRGSKPPAHRSVLDGHKVAPRAGAWIETACRKWNCRRCRSPPCGGRGSKPGLCRIRLILGCVALRAGAWIETTSNAKTGCGRCCRSLHGGVDRNKTERECSRCETSRPPCGGVGRNCHQDANFGK